MSTKKTAAGQIGRQLFEIFEALALNRKDLRVYQGLIGLGYATSEELAKKLSLPRQTVHSILVKLKELGLVTLSSGAGKQRFVAEPEMIEKVIKTRQQELLSIQKIAESLVPNLKLEQKLSVNRPTVKYYDGNRGLEHLFDSMLEYFKRPGANKNYRGFGINTHSKTPINKYLAKFIKKRAKLGVQTRLLLGSGGEDFTKGMRKRLNLDIKHAYYPSQNSGIYVIQGKIYLFSFADNAGLLIENAALSDLLKNIFDDYWNRIK